MMPRRRTAFRIAGLAAAAALAASGAAAQSPSTAPVKRAAPVAAARDSGVALFEAGRHDAAEPLLRARAESHPHDAAAAYWHGRVLLARGRPGDAMRELERAVRLDSTVVRHRLWLAKATMEEAKGASVFRRPGLAKRVRRGLEATVAYAPEDLEARRELLTFYLMAPGAMGGGMDKAAREADEIAARDRCLGHLAAAQVLRKRRDPAEEEPLRAAMSVCPDTLESYTALEELYRRAGREADAAAVRAARPAP